MNTLITGGAGFIGSHLSELLLRDPEARVTVLDDLSTGSYANVQPFIADPRFRLVVASVTDTEVLDPLVEECDQMFHLAAAVGVRLIVDRPVETIETNILGTEAVLKRAARYHKKTFIASTSEVYGKSTAIPFQEDQDGVFGATTKNRWSYACAKAMDEFLGLAYHREKGLPVVIGRLFNTVGPRQTGRYGMVIPNLVRQALRGEPLTVFGDGRQSRCFTHVRDSVRCQLGLMSTPEAIGQVVNIGCGEEVTILELAERILNLTGSTSPIQLIPYDDAYGTGFEDMQRRVPNVTRLRSLLGTVPETGLNALLLDIITWFRENPRAW